MSLTSEAIKPNILSHLDIRPHIIIIYFYRAQELCESQGGRHLLPIPPSRYGLCGCKATLEDEIKRIYFFRAQ